MECRQKKPFMFKCDTNMYVYIYIYVCVCVCVYFKCVIVSWSSATGSHYCNLRSFQSKISAATVMSWGLLLQWSVLLSFASLTVKFLCLFVGKSVSFTLFLS